MLRNQLDILRWYTIFGLLSMERVEPFLPEMGLNLPNAEAVRLIARRFREQYDQRIGDEAEDEALIQQIFTQIAQVTNDETAQDLYRWGLQRFPWEGPDDAREHAWTWLLRWLAGLGGREYPPASPTLPESKVKAIIQTVQDHLGDYSVLSDQMEEVERLPKSEWEERVYQSHGRDGSPLNSVESAIEFQRFHKTWKRIKALLNAEEMEALLQWGKSQAEPLGIPLDLVELPA